MRAGPRAVDLGLQTDGGPHSVFQLALATEAGRECRLPGFSRPAAFRMGEDVHIQLTPDERNELQHRLNNPLAIITGSAELMLMHPNPDEDLHRARAILLAAKRIQGELKELLGI